MLTAPLRPAPVRWTYLAALVYKLPEAVPSPFKAALQQLDHLSATAAESHNIKPVVAYAKVLCELAEKSRDWPSQVWSRFFPPWLHGGKSFGVESPVTEACFVLYAAAALQVQAAFADLNLATPQASREHALRTGASAVPSVHAKSAFSKATAALELVGAAQQLLEKYPSSSFNLLVGSSAVNFDAAGQAIEFIVAACKYFYALHSETSSGKHALIAKVAAAAATKSCPAGFSGHLAQLPAALLAATHKHLAEAAYAADKVPDMSLVLGHILQADHTLNKLKSHGAGSDAALTSSATQHEMTAQFIGRLEKEVTELRTKYEFENDHVYHVKPKSSTDLPDVASIAPTVASSTSSLLENSPELPLQFPLWSSVDSSNAGALKLQGLVAERAALVGSVELIICSASKVAAHDASLLTSLASLCRLNHGSTILAACSTASADVQRELQAMSQAAAALRERQVAVVGRALPTDQDFQDTLTDRCQEYLADMKNLEKDLPDHALFQAPLTTADAVADAAFPVSVAIRRAIDSAQNALLTLPSDDRAAVASLQKLHRDVSEISASRNSEYAAVSSLFAPLVDKAARLVKMSRRLVADARVAVINVQGLASKVGSNATTLDSTPKFDDPATPPRSASKAKAPRGKSAGKSQPPTEFPAALAVGEGLLKRLREANN